MEGLFKLRNGSEAIVMVNNRSALTVVSRDGSYLVLGPKDFDEFLKVFNEYICRFEVGGN